MISSVITNKEEHVARTEVFLLITLLSAYRSKEKVMESIKKKKQILSQTETTKAF